MPGFFAYALNCLNDKETHGEGGTGGGNPPASDPPKPNDPPPTLPPSSNAPSREQVEEYARNWLKGFGGDAIEALIKLMSENADARAEIRELKGKLPKDGTRVLTAEEAAELDGYRQLGTLEQLKALGEIQALGSLDEIKAKLAAGEEANARLKELERADAIRKACGDTFIEGAVTDYLPTDAEVTLEGEGEAARYVVKHGESTTPFDEWVKATAAKKPHVQFEKQEAPPARRFPTGSGQGGAPPPNVTKSLADKHFGVGKG